jgi:hypothetical protein
LLRRVVVTLVVSLALAGWAPAGHAAGASTSHVPNPVVTAATGGRGVAAGGLREDVTQFGYEEREFNFSGTAKTYPPSTLPPAPYRTRMIVWTPTNRSRFNGTTVVEWAEVSDFGQFELTVELAYQSPMLEEQGFAFVLVSAEQRGVCDMTPSGCTRRRCRAPTPTATARSSTPAMRTASTSSARRCRPSSTRAAPRRSGRCALGS